MDVDKLEATMQQSADVEMSRAEVQAVLDRLASHLELDGLKLDEDGSAACTVDDHLALTLTHLPGFPGVIASAPMPDAPEARGDLLRYLLKANMRPVLTRGSAFGLLPGDAGQAAGALQMCRHVPLAGRDIAEIDADLSAFVDDVATWSEQIRVYLAGVVEEGRHAALAVDGNPSNEERPELLIDRYV